MILPNCRELIDFLDDYVEHRLSAPSREAFDAHLAGCRECRNYLAGYQKTIELAKNAKDFDQTSASAMPDDLVRAILDVMRGGPGGDSGDARGP